MSINEQQRDALVRTLKEAGYVDPDDGTVCRWPNGNHPVRTTAENLAEALLANGWRKPADGQRAHSDQHGVEWIPFCDDTSCLCMEPDTTPCPEFVESDNPRCGRCGWPQHRHTEGTAATLSHLITVPREATEAWQPDVIALRSEADQLASKEANR